MAELLRSLNSLHIKGEFAGGKDFGGPHPIEIFIREPDCLRVNGHTANDNGRIRITDTVYAPDRFTLIDETDKTVTTILAPPAAPNVSHLRAEVADQMQTFLQMMFGPDQDEADFHRVRSETVGGVATDVYECSVGTGVTHTVWFNPATRLPVRTAYGPIWFDTIEADPVIPDAVFHPAVPVGYAVVRPTTVPTTRPDVETTGGCIVNGVHLNVSTLLALPGGDVLICWHLFDRRDPGADLKLPDGESRVSFTGGHGATYAEHLLHADPTPAGWHWRWSLLRPDRKPTGLALVTVTLTDHRGRGILTNLALAFPAYAVAARVQAAQRLTLPPGTTPMTLSQIDAAVPRQ